MKTQGIQKSLVHTYETSSPEGKLFYGFRKMFWTFLKKLNVPFSDPCCEDAQATDSLPVRYNPTLTRLEYHDGTAWVDVPTP